MNILDAVRHYSSDKFETYCLVIQEIKMESAKRKKREREVQLLESELKMRGMSVPAVNDTVRCTEVFLSYLKELLPPGGTYESLARGS